MKQFKQQAAHTMIEIMVSMAILSGMALMLASILGTASNNWMKGEEMVEASQAGRTALELIAREMTSPIVGPQQQFLIMNGATLRGSVQASIPQVPNHSMAAFWLAPLGTDGELQRVGFYLERNEGRDFYRLKRLFSSPGGSGESQFVSEQQTSASCCGSGVFTSATGGGSLLGDLTDTAFNDSDPDNRSAVVSTVSEGVLGFWLQSFDTMDNEIPWVSESEVHPACQTGEGGTTGMAFNSASMFQMATSAEFDQGNATFLYYRDTGAMTKGDRLPSAVEITILTVDPVSIDQAKIRNPGMQLPTMRTILDKDTGVLDVEASIEDLKTRLADMGILNARTFATRVKLANGS